MRSIDNMDDQERKQKRQQALEEYQQIVTYELPALAADEPPPDETAPKRKKKHVFFKFFITALLVVGMAAGYFLIGNWISSISIENKQLKEELAKNDTLPAGETQAADAQESVSAQDEEPTETEPPSSEAPSAEDASDGDGETPFSEESAGDAPDGEEGFTAIYPLRGSSTILHTFGAYTADDGSDAICYGMALGTDNDTQVVAAGGGTVIYAEDNPSTGLTIQIDHQNGYITEYTMNKELLVSTGQAVGAGQPIAIMGTEGEDGLRHMEFRVLYDGNFINPEEVLKIVG